MNGTIEYQLPNASVNAFAGVFTTLSGGSGAPKFARSDCVLNDKQQLLRGSCLRNTKWILGLVVYTGEESKVAMNSKETPEKMSNLEKVRGVRMQSQILRKQHSNTTGREHLNESHHDNDGDSCCDYEHLCFYLESEQVRQIRRCEHWPK